LSMFGGVGGDCGGWGGLFFCVFWGGGGGKTIPLFFKVIVVFAAV